jgi:glycerol-3-phosphate dehydrogenase
VWERIIDVPENRIALADGELIGQEGKEVDMAPTPVRTGAHGPNAGAVDAVGLLRPIAGRHHLRDLPIVHRRHVCRRKLIHRGLLPMVSGEGTHVRLVKESQVVDHAAHGLPGLVSMFGVRYTTARHTAEQAVDAVFRVMGHNTPPPCRTAETPLQGGNILHMDNFLRAVVQRDVGEISAETLKRIATTYGTGYDRVLQLSRDGAGLTQPLGRDCDVIGAEILYAARHEMAVKLGDALIRRTEAGAAGHPGADALERAAAIMAGAHDWDEWRTRNEIAEVEAFYRLPRD